MHPLRLRPSSKLTPGVARPRSVGPAPAPFHAQLVRQLAPSERRLCYEHQQLHKLQRGRCRVVLTAGLKIIEDYNPEFELAIEAKTQLFKLLSSDTFKKQIVHECQLDTAVELEFTELVFQPVPWSLNTPKGVPKDFQIYQGQPGYTIINVPPNFMFAANIANPSRLCAIYRHKQDAQA